jgi:hypothetical protein
MIDARSEGSTKACMLLIALVAILASGALAQVRPSVLTGWGGYAFDTRGRDQFVVEVNAGYQMSAVRTASGRIFVNGGNRWSTASVPPLPTGRSYVQMDVKPGGGAAVVDDGTVVVWGADYHPAHVPTGILTFPPAPLLPSGMTYLDVSAGASHVLAMRSDWQLIAWGDNSRGQCNVPTLAPGQSVVRMRALVISRVARRSHRQVPIRRSRAVCTIGWRCGRTARSSRGATTAMASAMCRHCHPV